MIDLLMMKPFTNLQRFSQTGTSAMERVLACKRQDTDLVKKSRVEETQAQVLILQGEGVRVGVDVCGCG